MVDRLKPALDVDIPGCNWILRFDDEGRAEPGAPSDIDAVRAEGEGYAWLHLDRTDARLRDLVARIGGLTEDAREALAGAVDHQFVEYADGVLFGAIVDHQRTIDGVSAETDFLRFALTLGRLLTARRSPLHAPQAAREALSRGARATTPLVLFEMLLLEASECSKRMLREIAAVLDKIEENIVLEGRVRDQRSGLGQARRKSVRLSRQVNGFHSTLLRLEEAADEHEDSALADLAASLAQRADSLCRDAANLQDRSRVLQEEINAVLTLETNDRLYLLTILTAVLLPATFVTGYFGMNTKQLPFSENENASVYATLLCLFASAGAVFLLKTLGITESGFSRRKDSGA